VLLCLVLLLGGSLALGCTSVSLPRAVWHVPATVESSESATVRTSLEAYIGSHVRQVKRPLVTSTLMTAQEASASVLGTPVINWGYDPSRLASAGVSPWIGLVPLDEHTYYFVSVAVSGTPCATLEARDMPYHWDTWVYRNRSLEASAHDLLDRYFGTPDYEMVFVEQEGVWALARQGNRSAGVLVEPWGYSHPKGTPTGVLTGESLTWWLAHPPLGK
jgi:hypothetical protein